LITLRPDTWSPGFKRNENTQDKQLTPGEDSMKILGIIVLVAALVAGAGFALSGYVDVSALTPHSSATNWALHGIMRRAVQNHAKAVVAPDNLAGFADRGAGDFGEMCTTCHGAPGTEAGEIGQGLNPKPPALSDAAKLWSDPELFWIVKNGIRMTGMPAFGPTHDDDRMWAIVAFVRQLPDMTPEDYARRTSATADDAPHDHDHHHLHQDHDHDEHHHHDGTPH
jgi:mono/diheme cytochrome c family protein